MANKRLVLACGVAIFAMVFSVNVYAAIISADNPQAFNSTEKGGFNLYTFVNNDPVNNMDYLGLKNYKLGTADPVITPDKGAGVWNSEDATLGLQFLRRLVLLKPMSLSVPDALAHLKHYLRNTGSDYTIRFAKMINDLTSLQKIMDSEIKEAKKFTEGLKDGTHNITSGSASGGYARKFESWNWFYAVGGYSVWGKGTAKVSGSQNCFELKYRFKFYDRYNWDNGKFVRVLGMKITDQFMGDFHRQGLAKEFDMVGEVKKTIRWQKGDSNPTVTDGWNNNSPTGGR